MMAHLSGSPFAMKTPLEQIRGELGNHWLCLYAGAGFNGGSFLNYNEDFSSMLMSVGFILAMLTYSLGLLAK
jgi:hypothetical protein